MLAHVGLLGVKMSGGAMSNVNPRADEDVLAKKLSPEKYALSQRLRVSNVLRFLIVHSTLTLTRSFNSDTHFQF